jgi:tetratricopeptide (TPR) repeat protein
MAWLKDSRGVPVSSGDPGSLAAYEVAVDMLHRYAGNPLAVIEEALARDPSFVLGHCLRAAAIVGATERPLVEALRSAVEAGEALAGSAGMRERAHLAAARAWLEGDFDRSVERYARIAVEWPRDTLAIQTAHVGAFYLGRQLALRDHVARVLHAWDEGVPGYGYVLGMYAFGLEETGDYVRAEELGRRAVELDARDGWASHAVAHVLEMQARIDEGVAWLETGSRGWDADNAFAYHNFWHLALYHLDAGDPARALATYDARVRPARSQVVLEMIDASALLWRLHLLGHDVGARFRDLADDWRNRIGDRYYAFNDVHALMAFLGAGRDEDARALVASVERTSAESGTNGRMAREVALPVCRALVAFAEGDHAACIEALLPVRDWAFRFGGSNAQRDVLSLTLLEAALRGRDASLAHALATERTRLRPANPAGWAAAARALGAGGRRAEAARAREQAARLRARLGSGEVQEAGAGA